MSLFPSFWSNSKIRNRILECLFLAFVAGAIFWAISNAHDNLSRQNIASGFSFLEREAGFEIAETTIEYWSSDSYARALVVGIINTLKVAVIGNFLALFFGLIIGVSALSENWMLSRLSRGYVGVVRNIPLLLQLFFWYALITEILPPVREALNPLPGVFLCQRGLFLPWPGRGFPELGGFNFQGGLSISPEFLSLLLGLVIYTAAFNAEIVRAGILSVPKGQWEAARALGLSRFQCLKKIIVPQAMWVAVPPLISQVLNLTKNSSLAVAIAYPDFVSVANTTMNQTGQAIEGVSMIMGIYLVLSLLSSGILNFYHNRKKRKGATR
jgi:general L-amino acid transport system permease protein